MDTFTEYGRLLEAGYFAPTPESGFTLMPDSSWLKDNRAAMYCGISAATGVLIGAGVSSTDLKAFAFPRYDGSRGSAGSDTPTNAALSLLTTLSIPRNAQHKTEAKDFLAFLSRRETAVNITLPALQSGFPLRLSAASLAASSRARLGVTLLSAMSERAPQVSRSAFGPSELSIAWGALLDAINLGATSVDQTRAMADDKLPVIEATRQALLNLLTISPIVQPGGGSFAGSVTVTLSTPTTGATIYYTIDGTEPRLSSAEYSGGFVLSAKGTIVVRAFAVAFGLHRSPEVSASFVITASSDALVARPSAAVSVGMVIGAAAGGICFVALILAFALVFLRRKRTMVHSINSSADLIIEPESLHLEVHIGSGSFGEVWKGTWRSANVAVKQPRSSIVFDVAAFADEARILHRLRHPHIVIFMGITVNPAAIVTEYMDRGSMYQVLHDPSLFLHPLIVLKWAHNITMGMAYLAASDVVHGDLKSLNVLIDNAWTPKICDFGMSTIIRPIAEAENDVSSHGSFFNTAPSSHVSSLTPLELALGSTGHDELYNVGTLLWAAPETVFSGAPGMTSASDAYSLGITLWELASRADLFPSENPLAVALDALEGRRPPLAAIPPSLVDIVPVIEGLWAQEPDARLSFDSAVAQLQSLYSVESVVYPSQDALPSGHVIVMHCEVRLVRRALISSPAALGAPLAAFHTHLPKMARKAGGHVLAWGLGWVTITLHGLVQLLDMLKRVTVVDRGALPIATLIVHGELETEPSVGPCNPMLKGPVMDELELIWLALFGQMRCGELQPPLTPAVTYWANSAATGEASAGLVASSSMADLIHSANHSLAIEVLEMPLECRIEGLLQIMRPDEVVRLDGLPISKPVAGGSSPPSLEDGDNSVGNVAALADFAQAAPFLPSNSTISPAAGESSVPSRQPLALFTGITLRRLEQQAGSTRIGSLGLARTVVYPPLGNAPVVLKTLVRQALPPQQLVDFVLAVATAAKASTPHARGPLAVCVERGSLAFIVPYFAHGSLADVMASRPQRGVGDPGVVRSLAIGLADAVNDVHECLPRGHGDVRPSNFGVERSGTNWHLYAIDFGLASVARCQGTLTAAPATVYISPEAMTHLPNSPAADMFVIGTILFELVTSRSAFKGTPLEICFKIRTGSRPDIDSSIIRSPMLRSIISRCWDMDHTARPSSRDMLEVLKSLKDVDFG
ncbi:uncharacterized protein AMSG_00403 [Thecamonas trahens ATCC 50062]|uniref:Protein kinase domain-containing protein n=1 Tax=Thecamonas trahens ATCC 50062 TaxID=461836 RepID=A0A0L0D9A4_THETB|nr:hypothetical protein AMSG_00403 [Thecamonas trahens ATCC 50062]KNC48626.1 hypothetical protein AMSG_00403 [Thecamonas trahens ATCC 50062]|eukprot:XP_013762682.1 hypothetical protein AMSG_00403 [Thecamonas trahens ATCC 50062]